MAGGIIGSLMYSVGFKFNSKGIKSADSKVAKLTKSVIGLGTAATTAMIGIGAAGLATATNYENAMGQIQMATGETAAQMEATREVASGLYSQNFGKDWNDLATSIASVRQITGDTGDELERTTKHALLLRDAFGIEVNESVRAAKTMVENFGITSEQAFNLMAQGTQKGLDFSGELIDTINEYSLQFKTLGFNADEMFDTLAAGSAEGAFNLDKVADAVKEFGIRSKDAGDKGAVEAFEMLGLNADKMMSTFAAGGPAAKQAFTDIVQMIGDISDPVHQNTVAVGLFGTQFEDLQKDVITAMGYVDKQFDMSKGTMEELNQVKFNRPGEAMAMFRRSIETGILIPIGQKLLPYLNRFGQWLSNNQAQIKTVGNAIGGAIGGGIEKVILVAQIVVPYIKQFVNQAVNAFVALIDKGKVLWADLEPIATLIGTKLVAAVTALWPHIQEIGRKIADVGKSVVEWEGFLPLVASLTAAFVAYKGVVMTITTVTKAASIATKAWSIAQAAFNAVMALNPIGIVVAALVGLGVALVIAYKRSDKFRAFINKMWAGVKKGTMAVINFFRVTVPKAFVTAFNAVTNFLKKWGVVLLAVILGPIGLLIGLVIKYWDQIKSVTITVFTAVWDWLKSTWNSITSTVSDAASSVWSAISGAWTNAVNATQTKMTEVWNKVKSIWDGIVTSIKTAGTNLWTEVKEMWDKVAEFFAGISLIDVGRDIINGLIEGIGSMAGALMDKVEQMGTNFVNGVKGFFGGKAEAEVTVSGAAGVDGSYAKGLSYVPYDGFIAELHKGERVLTAEENRQYQERPRMPKVTSIGADRIDDGRPERERPAMPQIVLVQPVTAEIGVPRAEESQPEREWPVMPQIAPVQPVIAEVDVVGIPRADDSRRERSQRPQERPYTPESAPARSSGSRDVSFTAPEINININGNADDKTIADIRAAVRQEMQDMLEAAARIMGVDIDGLTG
ncbi:hypothetical protein PA598K_01335 [Paenibacillus sp. 598K]|uniref:phage tail tape measure protein n=1 Tax=Paenibacillus sp. 598K TaxID=1117987 RepID=UPI000FF9469B|nr:phage tail tape measure protein [Paenibacillus sp. 598K]GBF73050.1 hypothetical protein PA598K_01335 [Paenibacillus sp. 598K]